MDVDMIKTSSSSSDQMDMITMMMHVDPNHQFYDSFIPITTNSELANMSRTTEPNGPANPPTNSTPPPPQIQFSNTIISNPNFNNPTTTDGLFLGNPIGILQEPTIPQPKISNPFMPSSSSSSSSSSSVDKKKNDSSMAAMREMIFRIAAMQPIHIDPESVKAPKRRNVKISKDPQSVAARQRRERISESIRILQRLVPGGTKMDTASMLDEAIHYVKFMKKQVQSLEQAGVGFLGTTSMDANLDYSSLFNGCSNQDSGHLVSSMQMLR